QWNIDLLGVEAPTADGEIVSIGALFLRSLGLTPGEVAIHLNSRRLVEIKLAEIGLGQEKQLEIFRLIDRRDKLPADRWQQWAMDMGLSGEQFDALLGLLADKEMWRESEELCQVMATADALGVADYVVYDAEIVRGLDYYTGPVFEARDREKFFRAIFGGGRYDNLVADVGGERLTGTGFAMGDVIIELLLERAGKSPQLPTSPSKALITLFDEELYLPTMRLASRIREAGIKAEQVLEPDRLGKQIRYADRKGIPFVVILGPDELQGGQVVLKNLATGEQETHTEESLIRRLAAV
ncbi:MAG TPA: ATP phosphoribosyltransferase regulatory subunit, partial [Anaerolineae bacterium]|nr:ATP phosphoribosyltransferase regulatory subunit [Anaerolineae bacterium]